ncbi:MAG: uroporphyrinogen-III C-methyltransferase [Tepidiformaceae bacterium]
MTDSIQQPPTGHVVIAGAGPGNPELATLALVRELETADVVLYDALAPAALLRYANATADLVFVGKRGGTAALSQGEIEDLIVSEAKSGKRVLRLKGGDPFVFGRGSEEALACVREGISFEVIPGISSALAAPAAAGIPVTHRGLAASFAVITGNEAADGSGSGVDWAWAAGAETLVILMGVASIADSMARLIEAGKAPGTPAATVRWGTRPDQEVVTGTVADLASRVAASGLRSPAVTVVGPVVALAGRIGTARGPLTGKRVVVTRARDQASDLSGLFRALGAYVIEAPVLDVRVLDWSRVLKDALASDWVALTSPNAVDSLRANLDRLGLDVRALSRLRVAAIGEATAERMLSVGLRADFIPTRATSAALAEELPLLEGMTVLYPASELADGRLPEALMARGASVRQVPAYTNTPRPLDDERLRELAEANVITFTSASTARYLSSALKDAGLPDAASLVSIGPETSAEVRLRFGRVDAEADTPSLDALVRAVLHTLE